MKSLTSTVVCHKPARKPPPRCDQRSCQHVHCMPLNTESCAWPFRRLVTCPLDESTVNRRALLLEQHSLPAIQSGVDSRSSLHVPCAHERSAALPCRWRIGNGFARVPPRKDGLPRRRGAGHGECLRNVVGVDGDCRDRSDLGASNVQAPASSSLRKIADECGKFGIS